MRSLSLHAFFVRPLRAAAPLALAAAFAGCAEASAHDDPPSSEAAAVTVRAAVDATCLVPVEHPANGEGPLWMVTTTNVIEGSTVYWRGFPSGIPQVGPSFEVTSDQDTHFGRVVIGRRAIIAGDQIVTVRIPDFGGATIRVAQPGAGEGEETTPIDRVYACSIAR